jgi:adenylate cyclase
MTTDGFKRKLTAILSADVEGYSRLMGEDEEMTVRTLTTYREMMTTLIKKHRGRVVDSPGDNLLADFASVLDVVRCAVEIQEELKLRNAELPENRKMEFRIGINLGDVIEEGDRIYGDGVNIAARVEGLAEAGGICISGTVFEHIKDKLTLWNEYLGEHAVKNIKEPVRVYRVRMEPGAEAPKVSIETTPGPGRWKWAASGAIAVLIVIAAALAVWKFYLRPSQPPIEPASVEKMAYKLPEKPSIAVLPFTNLSGDPEQEYLGDGLTEQIITSLSMVPRLFVIARNSTFTYKGRAVKVQQVAEELGVRYVLEGGVQKAGHKVRITAQLIDALKGHHLWAERYDRDLKDFFALQDEITKEIMSAIQVKLTAGEHARVFAKGTSNLKAYIKVMQGNGYFYRFNKEGNFRARKLAEEAVVLDPEYASAYCLLGQTHYFAPLLGLSKSPQKSLQESAKLLQKALAIDESHPVASSVLAYVYSRQGQHEKSLAQAERAVALNPNMAPPNVNLCGALFRVGRYEEAIQSGEKGIRLDPKGPYPYFFFLASAYCFAGRYEDAIATLKKGMARAPASPMPHVALAAIYGIAGREEEARAEVAEVLRIDPKFSQKQYAKILSWREAELEPWVTALRKAGLPETPPLPLPNKPSIAVLPFENLNRDPEQDYFVDGMTDTLITDLSKISGLFVIARNSVFTYKGKAMKVEQVSRELGVRYVLEGSIQKAGNQVRINTNLIDAKTGGHLWSERYDGRMDDVFALQDKITQKIVTALAVKLTGGEQEQVARKETNNIEAYDAFLKGWGHYLRQTPEDFAKAVSYFEKATQLDPDYSRAYASMALIYSIASKHGTNWLDALYVYPMMADKRAKKNLEMAMKNPTSAAYLAASFIKVYDRQYEAAASDAERALSLDPNDSASVENMAFVLIMAGKPEEGLDFAKKAMRLDPLNLANPLYNIGLAHFCLKEFEQAANSLERALTYSPGHVAYLIALAAAYGNLSREKEAEATLELLINSIRGSGLSFKREDYMYPHDVWERIITGWASCRYPPFKEDEMTDLLEGGLIKAGLKEIANFRAALTNY